MSEFHDLFQDLNSAINRLEEALKIPKNEFMRDSCIKRFELCMDLAWKTLKAYLSEFGGIEVSSPKTAFKEAVIAGFVKSEVVWMDLVDWRNEAVHAYDQDLAEDIYQKLPQALGHFQELLAALQAKQPPA